jgi:hypothetical protein
MQLEDIVRENNGGLCIVLETESINLIVRRNNGGLVMVHVDRSSKLIVRRNHRSGVGGPCNWADCEVAP